MIRSLVLTLFLLVLSVSTTAEAGTWGSGSFDNDDAADFVIDATSQSDTRALRSALERANAGTYLEAPDAANAIAAAEMIAAALGKPTPAASANAEVIAWVARVHPTIEPSLAADAVRVLNRILGDESELHELWAESDDYETWRNCVIALRDRLAVE